MEQMHLVVYLESKGCYEVKRDKKGMFIMRNKNNPALISGVPVASNENGILKQSTICSVCKCLDIEIPPVTSKEMAEMMVWINEDVKKRIETDNC